MTTGPERFYRSIPDFKLPDTPDAVTHFFGQMWEYRGRRARMTNLVTIQCPFSPKELKELEKSNLGLSYLPAGLETQQTRPILSKIFPEIGNYGTEDGFIITNDENPSGWFDYEAAIVAPYLDTTEKELMKRIKKDGRKKLLNLNQYIVASQDSKLLTGYYLDQYGTSVRLASRHNGRMISANFYANGTLHVPDGMFADDHYPNNGGRSSGV